MILIDKELDDFIDDTVNLVKDTVLTTMGRGGRLGLTNNGRITKDGVTLAGEVLNTVDRNTVLYTVFQACERQLRDVGDGTTLTALLACYFIENLRNKKLKSQDLQNIEKILRQIVRALKLKAKQTTYIDLKNIANTALNNSPTLAKLIADAVEATGRWGLIQIEANQAGQNTVEKKSGYNWKHGIERLGLSTSRMELNNGLILVTKDNIRYKDTIGNALQFLENKNQPLLFVSPKIEFEALQVIQKAQEGGYQVAWTSPENDGCLEDLAYLTGAKLFSDKDYSPAHKAKIEELGQFERYTVSISNCMIEPVKSDKTAQGKKQILDILESKLNSETIDWKVDELQKRIARINGAVAILSINTRTLVERGEVEDRIDDAVRSTKASQIDGYIDGGGVAMASLKLDFPQKYKSFIDGLLEAPIRQILDNAGFTKRKINKTVSTVRRGRLFYSIDESEPKRLSMSAAGIVDPLLVYENAILNAWSVAKNVIQLSFVLMKNEPK